MILNEPAPIEPCGWMDIFFHQCGGGLVDLSTRLRQASTVHFVVVRLALDQIAEIILGKEFWKKRLHDIY